MLRLVLFIIVICCSAQSHGANTNQLFDVATLSLKNGLVQSSVRGVIQDKQGLIWLGTEAGAQRFDGLRLKTLSQLIEGPADPMLSTIWVYHILQLKSGNIIFSTRRNGLVEYSPKTRRTRQYTGAGFSQLIRDKTAFFETCEDNQNTLYAATTEGLLQLDQQSGSWQVLIPTNGAGRFSDIACQDERITTRHNNQLQQWDKKSGEVRAFDVNSIVDDPDAFHIQAMNDGQLLIAKQDGLFKINQAFDGLQILWPQNPQDRAKAAVSHIYPEDDNTLWLATRYHGLMQFSLTDKQIKKRIESNKNVPYTLSGQHVLRIMKDHSGLLWASIYGVGIDRLNLSLNAIRTFYSYSENPLRDNDITAISSGTGDSIWFATNRTGASRLSLRDMSVLDFSKQVADVYQRHVPGKFPYISDIAVDNLNRLWFTSNDGLIRMNLNTGKSSFYPRSDQNPSGPRVRGRDIYIDAIGQLFVTDVGAILRYENESDSFTRIAMHDPTSNDANERLWGIRQNSKGDMYVLGTENLYQVKSGALWPVIDAKLLDNAFGGRMSAFATNVADDIYIAAQGALIEIVMTNPDAPEVKIYSGKQLPDNYFYSVEIDASGNPWLSTNNGIVQFNADTGEYFHFSLSDGVLVQEFNGRSSYIRPNGHIIFGGIDGFTVIAPEQLMPSKDTPRLTLSSYQIGSGAPKGLLPNGPITLNYDDHWLQFSFSALAYQNPQENQYAYFLEGFDPGWRNFGNKSEISFTGLPPGNYRLHAKAATKRGQWHPEPLVLEIVVTPPFYRSLTAYFLYLLIILTAALLFVWRRRKLNHERQHYVSLIELSQERMSLALWGSGDSIWDWHVNDNKVIRTAVNFLGYANGDFADTVESFKALIHPQDLPQFEEELNEVLAGHTAEYTVQYRMKDKNGQWVWVADQGKVVETAAGNKPVRLSGSIRDISQLKQHEQQLQHLNNELERKIEQRTKQYIDKNQELTDTLGTLKNTQEQLVESEKMASLGNLVAGISHEINTPVGVALTAATHNNLALEQLQQLFIERKLTVKDMEKGLNQLKTSNDLIESSLNRTAHLIQTFKQVAVDHSQQEWRIVEMPFYLQELIPTFQSQFGGKNIDIKVKDTDFFDVESAPGDIYQILSQLINNSVDHGFNGQTSGKIVIEAKAFKDYWLMLYQDNGNGMLNDTLQHIFEPFYTTKRGSGYAGLGMHLVYNIVNHSLGGTIECSSDPGKGIDIIIKLPLSKPDRPQPEMLQNLLHNLSNKL